MNPRPDIAMFVPAFHQGGAERVFVTLARGFCDAGYRVDMVAVKAEGPFLQKLDPRVNVVDLNASRTAL